MQRYATQRAALVGATLLAGLLLAPGCADKRALDCTRSEDCADGLCVSGVCVVIGDDTNAPDTDAAIEEGRDTTDDDAETDSQDVAVELDTTAPDDADADVNDVPDAEDADVADGSGDVPPPLDCGNGTLDDPEACDEGPDNSDLPGALCRTDCQLARCGDGILDPTETCDEGDDNGDTADDSCRTDCTPARCGDGIQDLGEDCDEGDANSDTEPDTCRTNCRLPVCGDGILDDEEACDGTIGCLEDCTYAAGACEACVSAEDCAERLACVSDWTGAWCLPSCRSDADCAAGTLCIEESMGAASYCRPAQGACGRNCGPEICGDRIDNDCNGFADCADEECADASVCAVERCDDGLDNDGDGLIDCADDDCLSEPTCACIDTTLTMSGQAGELPIRFNQGGVANDSTCGIPFDAAGGEVVRFVAPTTDRYQFSTRSGGSVQLSRVGRLQRCDGHAFECAWPGGPNRDRPFDLLLRAGEVVLLRIGATADNVDAVVTVRRAEDCLRDRDADGDGDRGCRDSDCNGWGRCGLLSECLNILPPGCPSGTSCRGQDCVCTCPSGQTQCAPGDGRCTAGSGCCARDSACMLPVRVCGG